MGYSIVSILKLTYLELHTQGMSAHDVVHSKPAPNCYITNHAPPGHPHILPG